ncbi:MAG: HD domain-containing protein [Candidatus Omnitrophica bacterium]|nr:HD domain-containing protein [Candidatus Omnitrophota bacterium]
MAYIPGRKRKPVKTAEAAGRKRARPARLDIDLEKLQEAYGALEESTRHLRESHIELILNFALAAEYKDPDTGNHILRISDYSSELGRALGLPAEELELLRYASPMHDIGKIGIPDSILQKPGKLTAEEWAVMQQHTLIGSRIFKNSSSPLLKAVSVISLAHHEKYDGTGYPQGLKGKAIPLYGRIVALADVFDAMVSKRCYKSALPFEEGFEHIRSLAGTHLDPDLVETFVRIKGKVRTIYQANRSIQRAIEEFGKKAR